MFAGSGSENTGAAMIAALPKAAIAGASGTASNVKEYESPRRVRGDF